MFVCGTVGFRVQGLEVFDPKPQSLEFRSTASS